MTLIRPLRKIAQAFLLGFAVWVLAAGAASAHGGHAGAEGRPAKEVSVASPHASHEAPAMSTSSEEAEAPAAHPGGTCPNDGTASHGEGCCTIACHAAMTVSGIDAWAGPGGASSVPMSLSDMLEGCSGDRSERPPRLA